MFNAPKRPQGGRENSCYQMAATRRGRGRDNILRRARKAESGKKSRGIEEEWIFYITRGKKKRGYMWETHA